MPVVGFAGFALLSAIAFAVAYHPILTKLSLGLVSPYAKADVVKRLSAAMFDGLLVTTGLMFFVNSGLLLYVVAAALYLLLRDSVSGRSVGKFLFGLFVIDLATGRPCGRKASFSRNAMLVLPGANLAAVVLEAATIVREPLGLRLGDRFATTQVVEGFGAKDVVTAIKRWWLETMAQLERHGPAGDREPAKAPRSS